MTFTKEQLQEIIDTDHVQCGEASALARMALAGMESVPVCYLTWHQGFRAPDDCEEYVVEAKPGDKSCDGSSAFPVYAVPQPLTTSERAELENYRNAQQVVPDENGLLPCPFCGSPAEHYPDGDMEGYSVMCGHKNGDCESWVFGFSTPEEAEKSWNTRAAMLQGKAEPRDSVRRDHAEWSQSTFGNVGPVGPLKHLSKEALEAAAEPGDLSEWADMQFLLWDAQRRAGITDDQITEAMIEKLAVNKARIWPEPKDGEPRLHIKAAPQQESE